MEKLYVLGRYTDRSQNIDGVIVYTGGIKNYNENVYRTKLAKHYSIEEFAELIYHGKVKNYVLKRVNSRDVTILFNNGREYKEGYFGEIKFNTRDVRNPSKTAISITDMLYCEEIPAIIVVFYVYRDKMFEYKEMKELCSKGKYYASNLHGYLVELRTFYTWLIEYTKNTGKIGINYDLALRNNTTLGDRLGLSIMDNKHRLNRIRDFLKIIGAQG